MRLHARSLALPVAAALLALASPPARAQNVGSTSSSAEPEQPQGQPGAQAPAAAKPRDLWKGTNYFVVEGSLQLRTVGMPQSTFSGGGTWPAYDIQATNLALRLEGNGLAVEIGRAGVKAKQGGVSGPEKGLLMISCAGNFGGMVSYQFPGTVIHVGLVWPEILVRESTDFSDTFILTGALALPAVRFSFGPAVLDARFGEVALDLEMQKLPTGTTSTLESRVGFSFVPAFEVRLGGWF